MTSPLVDDELTEDETADTEDELGAELDESMLDDLDSGDGPDDTEGFGVLPEESGDDKDEKGDTATTDDDEEDEVDPFAEDDDPDDTDYDTFDDVDEI